MSLVKSTKDYGMFKFHENNRKVDPINLKKIMSSIRANNLLEFRPILCDADMNIIDGQHRFIVAKELGVAVYYQINEAAVIEDIVLLNSAQKKWALTDYINYYSTQGKIEYLKLRDFCEKNSITITEGMALVSSSRGKVTDKIREGSYVHISQIQEVEIHGMLLKYEKLLEAIRPFILTGKTVLASERLKRAFFLLLSKEEFDFDLMLKKVVLKTECLRPCTNTAAYYAMLRDIYNFRNPNPIE